MKLIVFLMFVSALTAINLAIHKELEGPVAPCKAFLHSKIDNEDGHLVIKPGGGNYDESCQDIVISKCTLHASCKDRTGKYQMAELKLPAEFQRECCK